MNAITINGATLTIPAGILQDNMDSIIAHLDARGVRVSDLEIGADGAAVGTIEAPVDVDLSEEIDAVIGEIDLVPSLSLV